MYLFADSHVDKKKSIKVTYYPILLIISDLPSFLIFILLFKKSFWKCCYIIVLIAHICTFVKVFEIGPIVRTRSITLSRALVIA